MSKTEGAIIYHLAAASVGVVMLLITGLLGVLFAPGEWFVRYQLDVVQAQGGSADLVIQTRNMLLPRAFDAAWVASVEEIRNDANRTVCTGGGYGTYHPDQVIYEASLQEWVGDKTCALTPGGRYRIEAVWRFDVFGLVPQETAAVSEAFVAH